MTIMYTIGPHFADGVPLMHIVGLVLCKRCADSGYKKCTCVDEWCRGQGSLHRIHKIQSAPLPLHIPQHLLPHLDTHQEHPQTFTLHTVRTKY